MNEQNISEIIRAFDKAHLVKQIILVGNDGITRNIELEFVEDEE